MSQAIERQSEQEGLPEKGISSDVLEARRRAAVEDLVRAAKHLKALGPYQPEIPGVGATLMALRSREPMTPEAMAAAGMVGEYQRPVPLPVGVQMELPLDSVAIPVAQVTPEQVAANAIRPIEVPSRRSQSVAQTREDHIAELLKYGALTAAAIPGVYSTYDLFAGDANALNSGEFFLNSAIGLIPQATAMAGAGVGLIGAPRDIARTMATRRMAGGALAGAIAGGIPAVMMMRDVPTVSANEAGK